MEADVQPWEPENQPADKEIQVDALGGHYLLEEEQIAKRRFVYRTIPGIYFLIKNGKIVYVGKSVNIPCRLRTHAFPSRVERSSNSIKDFDEVAYVECNEEELDQLESAYIKKFQPIYNKIP